MNAKKSWVIWIIYVILFAGVVWGFAHGASTLDEGTGKGIAWMLGSLAVAALGVFLSYKLKKKE